MTTKPTSNRTLNPERSHRRMILINRNAVVAYALIASAVTLPAQQQVQVPAAITLAALPDAKLRSMIIVPEKKHSDADYATNMLQAMYDKAKAKSPSLTTRAFVLAFHDKAVAGDVDAGYYYGAARMAAFGIGQGPDKEIEGYIGAAAKAGKLEAIRDYAVLTFLGVGVKDDPAAAYALAKKAADGGLPSGMSLAAEFLQAGAGVTQSLLDAALLFKKAAVAGDPIAAYNMGEILSETDTVVSMKYMRDAATAGDDRGLLEYGMGLVYGRGVAKDEAEGMKLVQMAAQIGNPRAQRLMGLIYLNGSHGVKQDDTAGRLYMEAAAINGNSEAQIDFGLWNMDGDLGLTKDHDVGFQWVMKAAKQKNPRAAEELRKRM